MTTYHVGDTIRLKASFSTFAGVAADPLTTTCKIYDTWKKVLVTATATNESVGVYYYDYTTTTEGIFTYEFSGALESKTILARDTFTVGW